jgi:Uma2 family endonuclease
MQAAIKKQSKEYTVEDYLLLGEDFRGELIKGEIIMSPSPNLSHQRITKVLEKIFDAFVQIEGGEYFHAPFDVYFNDKNVVQPDVLLLTKSSLSKIKNRGIEGAPDLVVEILSPSNSHIDRYHKRLLYQKFGVKEYWIVDPNNKSLEILNFRLDPLEPVLYVVDAGEVKSSEYPTLVFELATIFS